MQDLNDVIKEVHMSFYKRGRCGYEKEEAKEIMARTGCTFKEAMDGINAIMHPKDFKWSEKKPVRQEPSYEYDPMEAQQKKLMRAQEKYIKSQAKCPRCGSTSLSYDTKKLSIGRAIVGSQLAGGLGAILGGLSSKQGYAVCLKCGKRWKI